MRIVCQSPAVTPSIFIPSKEDTQVGLSSSSVLPRPHYISRIREENEVLTQMEKQLAEVYKLQDNGETTSI